jgi:hypothetical protein
MEEVGLYWTVCSLIYSRGGPIDDNPVWLSRLFARTSARRVQRVLDALVETGKVTREPGDWFGQTSGKLRANRTETELKLAANRIQTARKHGALGGRPRKEINDLTKGSGYRPGFDSEKLSLTTNTIKESSLLPVQSSTQAQKGSGSAEKKAGVASPESIEVTPLLKGNRLARAS